MHKAANIEYVESETSNSGGPSLESLPFKELTVAQLDSLGYVPKESALADVYKLVNALASVREVVADWSADITRKAEASKNTTVVLFTKGYLEQLSRMLKAKVKV